MTDTKREPGIYVDGENVGKLLHPNGECTCVNEGHCEWCKRMVEEEEHAK